MRWGTPQALADTLSGNYTEAVSCTARAHQCSLRVHYFGHHDAHENACSLPVHEQHTDGTSTPTPTPPRLLSHSITWYTYDECSPSILCYSLTWPADVPLRSLRVVLFLPP